MDKKDYVSPSATIVELKSENIMVLSIDNDSLWDPMWNDA